MELKYIAKNNGYIIDRRLNYTNEEDSGNTFTTKGRMVLTELLPKDEETKKNIVEFAFDSMKDDILQSLKKKYYLKDKEVINFYFEGELENSDEKTVYAYIENEAIPAIETNFNLNFEVELKITPKNFFKIQYDNLRYKLG